MSPPSMKGKIVGFSVAVPVIAAIAVLLWPENEGSTPEEALVNPVIRMEQPPTLEMPTEPLPQVDVTAEDIERIRMRMLAAIAEDFRMSIESEVTQNSSIRLVSEEDMAVRNRYSRESGNIVGGQQ